ncbi:MAG: NAD-dependent epimerase/dehydratase family protein [Rhodocyclaceae bacterium]|nr:NAD-dependent epimerase/dehydratase family protein [Rhodocyclaceae bacterium]
MARPRCNTGRCTTLIVGGGGFIGSHLVALLAARGSRNIIVAGRRPHPRFPLATGARYVNGDINDAGVLRGLLDQCDEVIDLAYATVPKTSFDDPVLDVLSNLPTSVALLRESARSNLRRFILVSSGGTVYGKANNLPISESHPTNPISPYGITKLALEKYAQMYRCLEGLPAIIVRPSNAYGIHQLGKLSQGFVGASIHATLQGEEVRLFGQQGTTRDYIFVTDLAEGINAALEHGIVGETYNIGTGIGLNNREVLDLLDSVARPSGYSVRTQVLPERAFDVPANVLSSARLTSVSGWLPRTTFEEGIRLTWQWALTTNLSRENTFLR